MFFTEKENFSKKMVINMKENFILVKNKVMECWIILLVNSIEENFKMTFLMVKE